MGGDAFHHEVHGDVVPGPLGGVVHGLPGIDWPFIMSMKAFPSVGAPVPGR